ncbi:MAG: hypothetical protein ACEB74_06340 [Desulfovibrio aminophilus]|uniref:hypothetical protein n=1 Tax=Desulfovibrio aminophilus TaxID=81425 RepID=UPI0039E8EFAF
MNRTFSLLPALAALLWLGCAPVLAQDSANEAARRALVCGAPEDSVARVLTAVAKGQATPSEGEAILAPLVRACDAGLPPGLLADKLDEGLAKSVRPEVLRAALERRLDDLLFARALPNIPDEAAPPAEALAGLAEALAAGLAREELRGLAQRHPQASPEQFSQSARLMAFLARAGLPPEDARTVADAGLERGGLAPEWLQFPRLAASALKRGTPPQTVREAALETLRDGGGLREAAVRLNLTIRDLGTSPRSSAK